MTNEWWTQEKKKKAAQVNDESKVAQVSKRRLLSNCLWPTLAAKITFFKKGTHQQYRGTLGPVMFLFRFHQFTCSEKGDK